MIKKLCSVAILLLFMTTGFSADLEYSLDYQICGSAVSRLLFFFPLRVYYNLSAAINFTAGVQPDGKTRFVFEKIPHSAYLIRTLGFAAKTLALLTLDSAESESELFSENILARWRKEVPEFAARIKNIKRFPHILVKNDEDGLSFSRDSDGRYGDFSLNLEARFANHPSQTGIYFNIFPMLGDLLNMLNHALTPGLAISQISLLPAEWDGHWLDFSQDLNRLGAQLEKVVKSLVTIRQQFPFRMKFRVSESGPQEVEICGEAFPDVPLWKSFMIREIHRRIRVRLVDGSLVLDEIWIGVRNKKGHGGFGRLRLLLIK